MKWLALPTLFNRISQVYSGVRSEYNTWTKLQRLLRSFILVGKPNHAFLVLGILPRESRILEFRRMK